MKEFVCLYCGKKAVSTVRGGKKQKYCSKECRDLARKRQDGWCGDVCPHNVGVLCAYQECDKCGWNPEVEKKRKEMLYGRETEIVKCNP